MFFIIMVIIMFFCIAILHSIWTAIADSGKTPEERKNKFWYTAFTNIDKREVRILGNIYDIDEIDYAKLESSCGSAQMSLLIYKEGGGMDRYVFSTKDEIVLRVLEKKINDTKDYYSDN